MSAVDVVLSADVRRFFFLNLISRILIINFNLFSPQESISSSFEPSLTYSPGQLSRQGTTLYR